MPQRWPITSSRSCELTPGCSKGKSRLRERRYVAASEALRAVRDLADLWWGRLALGIAYVEAGHPAEALGELEQCRKRQGEATAILLDDLPSIRYLAPLPYWLARAQEAIGQTASARASYSEFLRIRSADVPVPTRLSRMAGDGWRRSAEPNQSAERLPNRAPGQAATGGRCRGPQRCCSVLTALCGEAAESLTRTPNG